MSTLSPSVATLSSLNFSCLQSLAAITAQTPLWQVFCLMFGREAKGVGSVGSIEARIANCIQPKSIDHVHAAAIAFAELTSGLHRVVSVFDGNGDRGR